MVFYIISKFYDLLDPFKFILLLILVFHISYNPINKFTLKILQILFKFFFTLSILILFISYILNIIIIIKLHNSHIN